MSRTRVWSGTLQRLFGIFFVVMALLLISALALASDHPTSNPYEIRPTPDGYLPYQIIPTPAGIKIDKDVMVEMPDGVKLGLNVYRPEGAGP